MYKSIIIILGIVWLICTAWLSLTRMYGYPYQVAATIGSWTASFLLLVSIIIYIKKHRGK
jgi:hypothetical protein